MGCDGELGYSDIKRAEAATAGLVGTPMYAQVPLCINPGAHYFQLDHIKRDTAVCTRCGLIRKASA